jgi:hypothetical protein
MTVATVNHAYCEWAQAESLASQLGLRYRLDDKTIGVADPQFKTDCIEQATAEIDMELGMRYPPSELAKSAMVKWWAAKLTTLAAFTRRLLPVPDQFKEEIARIRLKLLEIKTGTTNIPGIAELLSSLPEVINVTVDRRYRDNKIRVQPAISSSTFSTGANSNMRLDSDPISSPFRH